MADEIPVGVPGPAAETSVGTPGPAAEIPVGDSGFPLHDDSQLHTNPFGAPLVPGSEARPFGAGEYVQNKDGSWSSEESMTVRDARINGGQPSVIPSLYIQDKKTVQAADPGTAAMLAQRSGLKYPSFNSIDDAEAFSTAREKQWQSVEPGSPAHVAIAPLWSQSQSQSYLLPPRNDLHDAMSDARNAGYSWTDIQEFTRQRHLAAQEGGYTPEEVRQFLNLGDPANLNSRLRTMMRGNVARDGRWVGDAWVTRGR